MPTKAITVNGSIIMIDAVVTNWEEHGLTFPYAKTRDPSVIDMIGIHDSAGEGTGPAIYHTLTNRKLSIHFAVDRKGLIWQFLDPATRVAAHIGKGNNTRSVGIEISNAVFPPGIKPGLFANLKRYAITGRERLYGRPVIVDGYRSQKRRVLGHFPAQIQSVKILVDALVASLGVSPLLPRHEGGKVSGGYHPGWIGIATHFHLSNSHVDPAMDVLSDL